MGLEQDIRELSRDGADTLPAQDTRPYCARPRVSTVSFNADSKSWMYEYSYVRGVLDFSRKAKEEKLDRFDQRAVVHGPLPKWRRLARQGGPSSRLWGETQEKKKVRSMRGGSIQERSTRGPSGGGSVCRGGLTEMERCLGMSFLRSPLLCDRYEHLHT
jgi:hypothetical protein